MVDISAYQKVLSELTTQHVTLVAVSKTKPIEDILALYNLGHRDFGENYVQELLEKQEQLPKDIRWHFIGHLQSNKVKYIAGFVHLIHGVDNAKLLVEINKQASKCKRTIDVLLQAFIATEESKFGLNNDEIDSIVHDYVNLSPHTTNIRIRGLMGMASNTNDNTQINSEFQKLQEIFNTLKLSDFANRPEFCVCSMGMSGDYPAAVANGSTMVRIGSLLFGARQYPTP